MKQLLQTIALLISITISLTIHAQESKKEILVVGTFHFNNPGADLAKVKTIDVMSDKSQKELEAMADKIKAFHPDKVFVEWEYNEQASLDSLYELYKQGQYFSYIEKKYPKRNFYKQNEIFQLAFRVASKCKNGHVYAIDYPYTTFPYDSVMNAIDLAKQASLKAEMENAIKEFERKSNENSATLSLTQLILKHNESAYRIEDMSFYISLINRAGSANDFSGPYLVSEWYKRNLYMYSLVQKIMQSSDKKVMVLVGASHAAMFREFIQFDKTIKLVELKELVK